MSPRELSGGQPDSQPGCTCHSGGQGAATGPVWPPPGERAPRGWYRNPDRSSADALRFWDGRQWTESTRPVSTDLRVEYRPPGDAYTNLLLTVLTFGLWAPVWMVRAGPRYRVRPK